MDRIMTVAALLAACAVGCGEDRIGSLPTDSSTPPEDTGTTLDAAPEAATDATVDTAPPMDATPDGRPQPPFARTTRYGDLPPTQRTELCQAINDALGGPGEIMCDEATTVTVGSPGDCVTALDALSDCTLQIGDLFDCLIDPCTLDTSPACLPYRTCVASSGG